jgi:hypothetical protein
VRHQPKSFGRVRLEGKAKVGFFESLVEVSPPDLHSAG